MRISTRWASPIRSSERELPNGNRAVLAFNPRPDLNDIGDGIETLAAFMTALAAPARGNDAILQHDGDARVAQSIRGTGRTVGGEAAGEGVIPSDPKRSVEVADLPDPPTRGLLDRRDAARAVEGMERLETLVRLGHHDVESSI